MVNKQAVTSIITLKQRLKIYRSVKSFEMSPNKPHIWIYWDRLFTSVPTEPIFCILETNFRNFKSLFISRHGVHQKIKCDEKNNKITDLEYGFRKLILGFGLTKIDTDLSQLNFRNHLKEYWVFYYSILTVRTRLEVLYWIRIKEFSHQVL